MCGASLGPRLNYRTLTLAIPSHFRVILALEAKPARAENSRKWEKIKKNRILPLWVNWDVGKVFV